MDNNYWYENTNYYVVTVAFADPVLGERINGYGIFNKITSIREAECRRMNTAVVFCNQFMQDDMDRAARELEEAQASMEFPVQ